jgi:hypothetical protein
MATRTIDIERIRAAMRGRVLARSDPDYAAARKVYNGVIDLSPMRAVRVDPRGRTAQVQGGATLGDIDHATHPFGLAVPSGIASTTGIGGLTVGAAWDTSHADTGSRSTTCSKSMLSLPTGASSRLMRTHTTTSTGPFGVEVAISALSRRLRSACTPSAASSQGQRCTSWSRPRS